MSREKSKKQDKTQQQQARQNSWRHLSSRNVQPSNKLETRTYSDFETLNECMEGVCKIYEEHLKRTYPNSPSITYDISQLFDFIDNLTDLSCLVLDKVKQMYEPRGKTFIKDTIYKMLRSQAGQ